MCVCVCVCPCRSHTKCSLYTYMYGCMDKRMDKWNMIVLCLGTNVSMLVHVCAWSVCVSVCACV